MINLLSDLINGIREGDIEAVAGMIFFTAAFPFIAFGYVVGCLLALFWWPILKVLLWIKKE